MAVAIESGIGTLNYGKQTAKGTPAAAAGVGVGTNRPKWVPGGLKTGKQYDNEPYVDGQRFASPSVFTKQVGGAVGTPVIQAQPENAGLYWATILGVDTVTGAGDPFTHTITSAGAAGAWGTWWQKVGSAVGPVRQMYSDSKVGKLVQECGQDQYTMHQALDLLCLNPGEVFAVDPAKTEDASDAFIWSEMTGSLNFDGTVDTDAYGDTIEADTGMEVHWGDDVKPAQLIEKKGTITRTVKTIVTDVTLGFINKAIYGVSAPVAGNKPVKAVYYAAVSVVYTRSATRTLTCTTPKVAVDPSDIVVAPQAEGGKIEVSLGGLCLKNGASPALTIVALTGDATTYA